MAGVPRLVAPTGAALEPLDVRDPDVVIALADTVAILNADFSPRLMMGRMGVRAGFVRSAQLSPLPEDWIHPDDHAALGEGLARSAEQPGVDVEVSARVRTDTDGWHRTRIVLRNLLEHPDVQGILVRAVDETVLEREVRWRTLVGQSPIGIFELDLGDQCTFVNPAFESLTGIRARDALGDGWQHAIRPDDLSHLREERWRAVEHDEPCVCELRVVTSEGEQRWVSVRSVPLRDAEGCVSGFLGTLEDITGRKRLEERLEYDATHDRLTGLGSRALMVEELTAALARARRGGGGVALLFIDLDGFKRVNDTLGHAAGDELLVQVARRLRSAVRETDVCARLGGDEFVVCCVDMESLASSVQLADRLLARVGEPYDVHGHEVLVGASIGIATAEGEDPVSVDQLLSNADIASYRAKRLGRGRVEVFDEALRRQLARARRIGRGVGRLLDEPRLPMLCTPIVAMADESVVGFDCEVDWQVAEIYEDAGAVDRIVDESGMSRALDVARVRSVLVQLAEWRREPPGPIVPGLSVALTRAGALSPLFGELVRDMVARAQVDPSLCWLGVPEAAVAHDLETASRVAVALGELGVGVALRDFGSAVSSLEQLRRLPTPTITVAGPLVEAVHRAEPGADASSALLAAIVQYARALGRIVVAFGVQDDAHARRLAELGCTFGAGPAFGPRLRPAEVPAFLRDR